MKRYIAALDQGTTSSRCILFDQDQNILGTAQRELTQIYPQPGWVEQDPMEIWSTQYSVLTEVLAQTGRMELLRRVHGLPEPYREVVYLRAFGGLSFREIGDVLDKTETWARVTFYRGKERLKEGGVDNEK